MDRIPLVLIHGYSDVGESFVKWRNLLAAKGVKEISVVNYQSLTNEVTIKDLAEAFNKALKTQANLSEGQPFDAIVHSTGMLVLRSWLVKYCEKRGRLKHLIGLAPATFGSPLAHKGRSFLGAIFKGNKSLGPDFLESGDLILDGLELGSKFTWDLTHQDILADSPIFDSSPESPYTFIFCGNQAYGGLRRVIDEPGTDGTVRWAGCPLNTVKYIVDLSGSSDAPIQVKYGKQNGAMDMPFWPIAKKDHGSIIEDPGATLVDLVDRALQVSSSTQLEEWCELASKKTKATLEGMEEWQQFVVRLIDERGDGVPDYYIELITKTKSGSTKTIEGFDFDVHAYSSEPSYRSFHVNLSKLKEKYRQQQLDNLWLRVVAKSGTKYVGYCGTGAKGIWDAEVELPSVLGEDQIKFFYPFTTTLVEIRINREPQPFGEWKNELVGFIEG